MSGTIPYFGEILSFLTAIVWAFAVILFRKSGETVDPIALNLFKNLLAIILFLPTMLIFGEPLLRHVPHSEYLLLFLSGLIGIGIGDTLFLKSLNLIGAGLSAIVECMYSPFIIGLSILWLGESMTLLQIIGVLFVVSAVLFTMHVKERGKVSRRDLLLGILFGVIATASMGVGIVMIKPLLERSPLLWAMEVRLFGGVFGLVIITLFHPFRRRIISSLFIPRGWGYTISGSFLGSYLAMLIWLAGMKYTKASIASALNQTSTIFIFVFAAILLKEPITTRRILAVILAVLGALLVFLG
jgi:drug/metabolite transporter (DMT)-like permease